MEKTGKLGEPIPECSKEFWRESKRRVAHRPTSPKLKNTYRGFFEIHADEKSLAKRHAKAFAYALESEPIILMPNERLTGITYHAYTPVEPKRKNTSDDFSPENRISERVASEIPDLLQLSGSPAKGNNIAFMQCSPGHIGWHWDWILKYGIKGLIERVENAMSTADARGVETLACMRISLKAVLKWNNKHIQEISKLEKESSGEEKERLSTLLRICERVPYMGARSFREAVQSFHFSYLATMYENPAGGNGPGRLDYHLWPYLERDLAAGTESISTARELIDELFIRFHERMLHSNDGHVETIVVGGCHPDGTPSINPLTRIMIESIAGLKISHPSVYIRIPENAPDDFVKLAARDLSGGGNRAQVLNDKEIIQAITRDEHIPLEDARMYMCGGCMEISPHGMNGDLLFSGFFNALKVLEMVITGGICLITGERLFPHLRKNLADFANFDEFSSAFFQELERTLNLTFKLMDITSEEWAERRPRFLVSAQVEDCIVRGRCINDGGAKYEDFGSTPLGLPNVADSLLAVKKAVFEDSFVSPCELLEAMRGNFKGGDLLQARLKKIAKYGEGDKDADAMMAMVVEKTCEIFENHTNRLNGKIKPMIMTFMMGPVAGGAVGATPDGRLSGTTLAQGVTPQNSAMRDGLTTAMVSQSKIPLHRFSGGASSMWDLDSSTATLDNINYLLKSFMSLGGQMFQGNTTDVKELIKAKMNPEEYENLMVRIGGYSGRFVTLAPNIQDDVINRQRHKI